MVPVSLVRLLAIALIFVGFLELGAGLGEIYVTQQNNALVGAGVMPGEGWLVMTGYVRAASDGLWTMGFGGVVAAAGAYLARGEAV